MVDYQFNTIIGQIVSFFPDADRLQFTTDSAKTLRFTSLADGRLQITGSSGSAIITAAGAGIEITSINLFTPANVTFSDGSALAVGDLTGDAEADDNANVIDFNAPALLASLTSNNVIYGQDGADSITATSSGDSVIYGGSGLGDPDDEGDTILLGSGSNLVYGNGGNDGVSFGSAVGAGERVTYYGGAGADSITSTLATGSFLVDGGAGADSIILQNTAGASLVYGGSENDVIDLSGSNGANTIYGGRSLGDATDGADTITLGTGNSTLYANGGADVVATNGSLGTQSTIYLGGGTDSLTAGSGAGSLLVYGSGDGDTINLSAHNGDATVYGGNSINDAGDGADIITASLSGSDIIYANGGDDEITLQTAAGERTTLYAGAGNDTIIATPVSSGAMVIYGNGGDDLFQFDFTTQQTSLTILDYGVGSDSVEATLSGGQAASGLVITRSATQTILTGSNGEQIILNGFNGNLNGDGITLSDGSLLITNYSGNAVTLSGGTGGDQLIAGSRGDTLTGGTGNDRLTGGIGEDWFRFASAELTADDTVDGSSGRDRIEFTSASGPVTDTQFDHVSNVEALILSSGNFATTNSVTLGTNAAAAGISIINASETTQASIDLQGMTRGVLLQGGDGDDTLIATNLGDAIDGKDGDDTITAGRDNDTIRGGDGDDVFVYNAGSPEGTDRFLDVNFGSATTAFDRLQFASGASGFNLGNQDTTVDGAIITDIESAGALGTEVIILRSMGLESDDITAALNVINSDALANRGILNLFYDITKEKTVLFYDVNGSVNGGHTLLAEFDNQNLPSDVNFIDFGDFVFV